MSRRSGRNRHSADSDDSVQRWRNFASRLKEALSSALHPHVRSLTWSLALSEGANLDAGSDPGEVPLAMRAVVLTEAEIDSVAELVGCHFEVLKRSDSDGACHLRLRIGSDRARLPEWSEQAPPVPAELCFEVNTRA